MKPKKHPKKDLNRSKSLYFFAALALVMLLTYAALEWKTYDLPNEYVVDLNNPDDQIEEEVPIFKLEVPPPQPPVAPNIIEIVPDDPEINETPIATTEPLHYQVVAIDSVVFEEIEEEVPVNWASVEEVPVFPGCENENDKRACFQKMIGKHISKNFRYPEMQRELEIQGKVYVQFVIEKDGEIGKIQLRGPDNSLEAEAARIIGKLPKMKPGKQGGKPVKVPFSIPITFKLQ